MRETQSHEIGNLITLRYIFTPESFSSFSKGNNFHDFLFAFLDDKAFPKSMYYKREEVAPKVQILFFNSIALRTAKTLWSFDRSQCNMVKS